MMRMRGAAAVPTLLLMAWACSEKPADLPSGLTCDMVVRAGDDLSSVLRGAKAGTCVVPAPGTYRGSFLVPPGVSLAAERDSTVVLEGDSASEAAVTLSSGAGLLNLQVGPTPGIGVRVEGERGALSGIRVHGAGSFGIVAWTEDDTRDPEGWTELSDVEVVGCGVGLWVHGRSVRIKGGRIAGSLANAPSLGHGVIASRGARLHLVDTRVESNAEIGLLADGAATSVELSSTEVLDNLGPGVWGQGLQGSEATPALRLSSCTVAGNRMAGIGLRGSLGVQIQGGRIANTALLTTLTDSGAQAQVGDGLALFQESGAARLDEVVLEGNERSQVLVDQGHGVTIVGGRITPTGSQLGVVVQRTTDPVTAPVPIDRRAAGDELPFSAPAVALP